MTIDRPVAAQLSEFITATRVPTAVSDDAACRLLDVVGNCLAALGDEHPESPHAAVSRVALAEGGRPIATALGLGVQLPVTAAAMVNGTLAHELDFDDTHLPAIIHPSSCVVPSAVAIAEEIGATGPELLAAIAIGNEVCARIGAATYLPELRNSVMFEKGFSGTAICGAVGAAAAAARLYRLDIERTGSALAIAAGFGSGLLEANRTGGSVKRIQCGWAAQAGIRAAQYARSGITGPPTVFEGRFGFLTAFVGDQRMAPNIVAELSEHWEALRIVYKPYPTNHFTHPAVDCVLALRSRGLRAEDVESVEVGVSAAVKRTIGEPPDEKAHPRSAYHAKFSAPYVVASALLGGGGLGVYLDDFDEEGFPDPARIALASRVIVVADAVCSEEFPNAFSAVVRVRTRDGNSWEQRVHSSRGGPGHPLSLEEVAHKFRLNASRILTSDGVESAETIVRGFGGGDRVQRLGAIVADRTRGRGDLGRSAVGRGDRG